MLIFSLALTEITIPCACGEQITEDRAELCLLCGAHSCGADACLCRCESPDYAATVDGDSTAVCNLIGAFAVELDAAHSRDNAPWARNRSSVSDLAATLEVLLSRPMRDLVTARMIREVAVALGLQAAYVCDERGELRGSIRGIFGADC